MYSDITFTTQPELNNFHLKMIYIKNYYTWAAVEYYLLHYVLKQYDIQKQRKKDQISDNGARLFRDL